jgi:histidinol-phosphate phosphatase family protein
MTRTGAAPAVFVDRDGTIVREVGYLRSVRELRLLPGAAMALRRLRRAGARIVVVSNQSGIGRGYVGTEVVEEIHAVLCRRLRRHGAEPDAVYFCPHLPESACGCRKPAPGLIERARAEMGIDPGQGYVIGDLWSDIGLARAVGARGVLVLSGHGHRALGEIAARGIAAPDHVAPSLPRAVDWILADWRARAGGRRRG